MKAMLLAAGFGERMLPLTGSLPKPAIPVLGRPLVLQILHRLAQAGVGGAVINLHHLPDELRKLVGSGGQGLPSVAYTFEETILGTGGGLRNAAPLLRGEGTIVITNSDFLADIDIEAGLAVHRRSGLPATLVLTEARAGYSVVEVDQDGRILSFGGTPEVEPSRVAGRHLFTGMHFIEESVLDLIPQATPNSIIDVYRRLLADGKVGSFVHDGFWWEFGSPELLFEGSLVLLDLPSERRKRISHHDPVRKIDEAVAAVGPGVIFDPGARLHGHAALGFASRVGRGCRVDDCIVMPEAWVGPGCDLKRCIVGPGVELPAEFAAEGALICGDHRPGTLPPQSVRRNGLIVHELDLRRTPA
ncbi:MAG: NDP-sugar synthase [bacterium]|nr:NDP-sugar synthase [bacterium]